jgi:DNA-binding response OmpR family regulator
LAASGTPLPTLLVTAHADEDSREDALAIGIRFYLAKPLEADELLCCLRSALGEGGPGGSDQATGGDG